MYVIITRSLVGNVDFIFITEGIHRNILHVYIYMHIYRLLHCAYSAAAASWLRILLASRDPAPSRGSQSEWGKNLEKPDQERRKQSLLSGYTLHTLDTYLLRGGREGQLRLEWAEWWLIRYYSTLLYSTLLCTYGVWFRIREEGIFCRVKQIVTNYKAVFFIPLYYYLPCLHPAFVSEEGW